MATRPLRRILSLQSMLVAAVPFLAIGLLGVFWLRPQIRSDIETRQLQLAGTIATQIQFYLSSALSDLKSVTSFSTSRQLSWQDIETIFDTQVTASDTLHLIYGVDPSGRIAAVGIGNGPTSQKKDLRGLDFTRNHLYREALDRRQPIWSNSFLSIVGGGPAVAIALPVGDTVFFGEVELSHLSLFLQNIADPGGQIIFIIDRRGQVIADQNGRYTAQQFNLRNLQLIREGLAANTPVSGEFDIEGREMIGTMIPIPEMGWEVLIAWPTQAAFSLIKMTTHIAAVGLGIAVLLSIVAAWLMSRVISGRVEVLAGNARRIAMGEGAFAWPRGNIQEFNQLSTDLQQMADSLRERERQIGEHERLLQSVMDNAFQLQGLLNPEGILLDVNRTALDLIGAAKEDVVGRCFWDTPWWNHNPETRNRIRRAIKKAADGEFLRFEATHLDTHGALHYIDVSLKPIKDDNGKVIYLLPEGRDINDRKQAEAKILRHMENLASLRMIDAAINSSLDLRVTLDVLLEQTLGRLQVDAACVLLFSSHTQILTYAAGLGFRTDRVAWSRVLLGEGLAGVAAFERKTLLIKDLSENSLPVPENLIEAEQFRAYVGVPLVAKGEIKGVLELFHRSPLEPDQEWLEFAEALAGQAAIALDNAELFEHLQRTNAELLRAYDTTIEGWAKALDLRDEETEGHSRRVTWMTERLGRMFDISEEELVHMRRGALLHDIGKLGVPDKVLLKKGRLNGEEQQFMQEHPTIAYRLLAPIPFLRPAVDIPYCHHERWDGTGYPRRLKGEEIPLAARIFAVVDIWDALLSDRPYRSAWPVDKVREYIKSLSRTHLDPVVVETFLDIEPEFSAPGDRGFVPRARMRSS